MIIINLSIDRYQNPDQISGYDYFCNYHTLEYYFYSFSKSSNNFYIHHPECVWL